MPPLSAKLLVPKPPAAVTGTNDATTPFVERVIEGCNSVVTIGAGMTVRLKVWDEVCATGMVWSVAVTVKVAAENKTVAVPVI